MDRGRVIVIALLLCLAPLGGISAGATQGEEPNMSVAPEENTSEYLAPPPDEIDRSGQHTTSLDVGGAVSANAAEVRTTYSRVSMERNYRNAESTEERRRIVSNGTERVDQHVDELLRREQTALQRYSDGQIGETELLRTLSVIHRETEVTVSSIRWLENRANNLGMEETADRLALQQVRLLSLQGPVRASIDEALAGEREARVHVDVSGDGLVLAMVDDSEGNGVTYVREAHDPTAITVNTGDRYGGRISPAEDRISELYPWVTDNGVVSVASVGPENARLYRFTYTHPHGELATYLDSGSADITRELQYKDVERVPTTVEETTEGNLRLAVNTTRAGGPLGVTVYDTTTGQPLDAEVEVNGRPLGSTGGDRLWTVAPRGQVTVNATHDGDTLTVQTNLQ